MYVQGCVSVGPCTGRRQSVSGRPRLRVEVRVCGRTEGERVSGESRGREVGRRR